MDMVIYIAVILAIIVRLVIMKGKFTLPTFYKNGNEVSFNLGSIATIIIAVLAALGLMYTYPEQFASPIMAFMTTYAAPQIVDGVITYGTRKIVAAESTEVENEQITESNEEEAA